MPSRERASREFSFWRLRPQPIGQAPVAERYLLELSVGDRQVGWMLAAAPDFTPGEGVAAVRLATAGSGPQKAFSRSLWDRGVVTFADPPASAMRRGSLKFELAGAKLNGGFVLVRSPNKPGAPWVLSKIEDAHAAPGGAKGLVRDSDLLWPKAGVGRAELADYYERIAPFVARFIENRPLTTLRATRGVGGPLVFERSPRGIQLDQFRALAERFAVVEFHAMSYRFDRPNNPDWMILDLDPPWSEARSRDLGHGKLMAVADATAAVLAEIGLRCVWKLSGHGGLHVMIPLNRQHDTVVVFDFSKMLAELIHERVPQHSRIQIPVPGGPIPGASYEATRSRARQHQVFIDYRRNHYHQSIVAPFSPRATQEPSIALPISWDRLRAAPRLPRFGLELRTHYLQEAHDLLGEAMSQPNDLEHGFAAVEWLARKAL